MTHAHDTRRKQSRDRLNLNVLSVTLAELEMEGVQRSVPLATLCAKLLDVIASDSTLIDAILDGEYPRKNGAT
jgi:hypothetical protein